MANCFLLYSTAQFVFISQDSDVEIKLAARKLSECSLARGVDRMSPRDDTRVRTVKYEYAGYTFANVDESTGPTGHSYPG